jgi:hypothetical protein
MTGSSAQEITTVLHPGAADGDPAGWMQTR